ncbi:ATP-binding protein [Oceanidesulfovibrio marinus]|uniref:KAP family P-loop domain-containing protein n=1 Tax=Oceanidesulfovibrio marinus TaxID=370038 RepID=A0A6P1ZK72_9BACT|nr:ATP-binding protein [Oceanidesulfovibrio marinus]TVM35190.1 hypothetical protein DQK91_07300 [Oceanidesulfovibrio marinus]
MHEAVIQAFRSYLDTPATEHALLLTGRWGSGKTFLWRNHLEPAARNAGRPAAYVSLYSCNSLEDITVQLYMGLVEAPAEDSVPGFLRAVSGTASFALAFFREEYGPVLPEASKAKARETTVKNLVICFDDLERSTIPVEKLLGYVNELTERHHCKAIILCNEEEMREKDSYEKFKEKTVGRAIAVQVDYPEVVASIIGQFAESQAYHKFLQDHTETIAQIFERSGTRNIRLARLGLSWMHIIYAELKALGTFHTIIYGAKLLKIVMACCFEQMSHLVARDDVLGDIFADRGHIASLEHDANLSGPNAYIAEFLRRYYGGDGSDFFAPPFLLEFMHDGTLDRERMREELPLPKVTDPIQESVNLFLSQDYLGLDDETFEKHLANVRLALERGRIGSLREYARLFVVFFYCREDFKLVDNLVAAFQDSMKLAVENGSLRFEPTRVTLPIIVDGRLPVDLERFKESMDEVEKALAKRHHDEMAAEFYELLRTEPEAIGAFIDKCAAEDRRLAAEFFAHLDASRTAAAMRDLSNEQLYGLKTFLRKRYAAADSVIRKRHETEAHFFGALLEQLSQEVGSAKPSLRRHLLRQVMVEVKQVRAKMG